MSRNALILGLGLALWSAAVPVNASEPVAIEVFQPIDVDNFIHLSRMTYVGYHEDRAGGAMAAVSMTCDSNCVLTYGGPENRNVAFAAGLKSRALYHSGVEPGIFGDTMRVELDARALKQRGPGEAWADTVVLAATVQCILANAAQLAAARFVDLRILGAERYRRFGGVYALRRFRHGPLRREFY